jgi:hypothetical protein
MNNLSPPTVEHLRLQLLACLDDLAWEPLDRQRRNAAVQHARAMLETLPLTTAEIATARNRLENARSYQERGEHGAAHFELRLLGLQVSSIGGES